MTKSESEFIEDVPNSLIDVESVKTDDELKSAGLVPVRAFVRTKASKNALRVQKHKAKAESGEDGQMPRKQLNLVAPADDASRKALKEVADAMLSKSISPDFLFQAMNPAPGPDPELLRIAGKAQSIIEKGGLRAKILRKMLS